MKNIHVLQENIYITSNEEIKDGDWFLTDDKRVEKCAPDWRAREWHKKIILTTDQDLIKDGVQAIDDEFLEWFVKNPSCEFVEVNINSFGECHMEGDDCSCYDTADQSLCKLYYPNYKIIISKEEPKQRLEKYSERFDNKDNELVEGIFNPETWGKRLVEEPKQETLEEVVNNFKKTDVYINEIKQEQERNYSEEDMNKHVSDFLEWREKYFYRWNGNKNRGLYYANRCYENPYYNEDRHTSLTRKYYNLDELLELFNKFKKKIIL